MTGSHSSPVPDKGTQTLDRGLRVLRLLAAESEGLAASEIGVRLALHRSAVYRVLVTLQQHGLAVSAGHGRYRIGLGVLALTRNALGALRDTAQPQLQQLADSFDATSFLVVAEGEWAVAVLTAEPDTDALHVAYRPGSRHPLARGAGGIAVLAGRTPSPDDTEHVRQARERGAAVTRDQLTPGATGVAVGLRGHDDQAVDASVGLVALHPIDENATVAAVTATARRIDQWA